MDILPNTYEKQQICNYLIKYQHLCDDSMLKSKDNILGFIGKVGCIQYDPLDVVGRNPDLVLQSRCCCYEKGDIEKYLYADRVLFDVWDKNMSICTISDWPCFEMYRKPYLIWCEQHKAAIDEITKYLETNDFACSSDFKLEEKVDWHYGPQRLAKAALESCVMLDWLLFTIKKVQEGITAFLISIYLKVTIKSLHRTKLRMNILSGLCFEE